MDAIVNDRHKVVLVPPVEQAVNLFAGSQRVTFGGNEYMVVPHKAAETFMLRRMGFNVPSPILTHYDWPGTFSPFDAQRQTCALLTMNKRAFVLNSMGTGKTSSALWAWDFLNKNSMAKKLIIVAPLSTLKFTWAREVLQTIPHRKCVVVHAASKAKRLEQLKQDADIFIINHHGVKLLSDQLAQLGADTLVIDELAIYRNGKSELTKSIKAIAATMEWVWGMTGSPMPHAPTDVWAQCQVVQPDAVPRFFSHWRDKVMVKINQFKYVPKDNAIEEAFKVMQPAVRFTLDDVMELPEQVIRTQDVDMGPKQSKVYKELAKACYSGFQNHEITAANAGAVLMKLLQVSCGWVYDSKGQVVSLDNEDRIKALIDVVDACDQKVLVFAPFIHSLEGISKALEKEGYEHVCVSGATSANKRAEIFNEFQNSSKYKVLVAHPQCLAHGVTLTAANTIVWFGPVTSLEIYEQANARIRRVGQKHKQLVLHLQSTPVEKRIYKILQANQQVQNAFLDMFKEDTNANPLV